MQAAAVTMEKIAAATSTVAEKMTSLAHRSEEIGKVVSVIQEISEQNQSAGLGTPPSKRPAPGSMAADLPSSPVRCAAWPSAPRAPRGDCRHHPQHSG